MITATAQPVAKNRPKGALGKLTKKTYRTVMTEALTVGAPKKKRIAAMTWLREMDGDGFMAADEPMDSTPGAAGEDLDAEPDSDGIDFMKGLCEDIEAKLADADERIHNPKWIKDLQKIKAICDSYVSDGGKGGEEEEETPEPAPTEESRRRAAASPEQQALKEENARLKRVEAVRALCDASKFTPSAVQLKALAPLADTEAKSLIESFKGGTSTTPAAQTPVSQSPGWKSEPHPGNNQQRVTEQKTNPSENDDEARKRRVQQLRAGQV